MHKCCTDLKKILRSAQGDNYSELVS